MIQTNGYISDLFLNRYNEVHQSYSIINQTNTDTNINSLLNYIVSGESYQTPDCEWIDHNAYIDTDSDIENCSSSCRDQVPDATSYTDSDSDCGMICYTYGEPLFVGQCHLLFWRL